MFDFVENFINPQKNPNLSTAFEYQKNHLPTLWLLGKTGAGKSSLIQSLTELADIEVGNGFSPCTKSSVAYDFPQDKPILRFLDTRGLGEAEYDPSEDIQVCVDQSHVLLIIAKADEPEQSSVVNAIKNIRKQTKIKHILIVHSAVNSISGDDKNRMLVHNQTQFENAWGKKLPSISIDFDCINSVYHNRDELINILSEMLPIIELIVKKKQYANLEEDNFEILEKEVLWYSGSASASDLIPFIGLFSVPAIQAKMLHSLASQYDVEWNKRIFGELISSLGTSFSIQYSAKLGARQLAKLIPVYGQTIASATAAAISFATTYSLGRAACYYFHQKKSGQVISKYDMQKLYKEAFKKSKKVSGNNEI